jgi:hypothetical protein
LQCSGSNLISTWIETFSNPPTQKNGVVLARRLVPVGG